MPRRRLIRWLPLSLLAASCLAQIVVPLARIGTSYRATELELSESQILALSSAFSLLPAFLAVHMGRYNDRHGNGRSSLAGALLMAVSCLMLLPSTGGVWWLLAASVVLGLGQTLQLTALQGEIATFRLRRHREGMVGGLMLWQAIGQVSAPMILSIIALAGGQLSQRLALVASALALVCVGLGLVLWRCAAEPRQISLQPLAIGRIFSVSGLGWVMLAGSLCVAVYDLTLIYMPVIGETRGIPAEIVGLLLTLLACGQMLSRALYRRVQMQAGSRKLMLGGVLGTALLTVLLGLPLHILAVGAVLGLIGVTMGFAITSSVALTMTLAPPGARVTSLGLRLAMNRAGQFVIPLAAGGAAAILGAGAVFFVLGLVLGGVGLHGPRVLSRTEPAS